MHHIKNNKKRSVVAVLLSVAMVVTFAFAFAHSEYALPAYTPELTTNASSTVLQIHCMDITDYGNGIKSGAIEVGTPPCTSL